jgi:acyl-CoA thioester hydrolase
MSRTPPPRRKEFSHQLVMPTRWTDNDMLGHMNNVLYYRFFEIIVVDFCYKQLKQNFLKDAIVPYTAETHCRIARSLSFPMEVHGGLRIEHLGRSSARLGIGLFAPEGDEASAWGYTIHVYVDKTDESKQPIPPGVRAVLERHYAKVHPHG